MQSDVLGKDNFYREICFTNIINLNIPWQIARFNQSNSKKYKKKLNYN